MKEIPPKGGTRPTKPSINNNGQTGKTMATTSHVLLNRNNSASVGGTKNDRPQKRIILKASTTQSNTASVSSLATPRLSTNITRQTSETKPQPSVRLRNTVNTTNKLPSIRDKKTVVTKPVYTSITPKSRMPVTNSTIGLSNSSLLRPSAFSKPTVKTIAKYTGTIPKVLTKSGSFPKTSVASLPKTRISAMSSCLVSSQKPEEMTKTLAKSRLLQTFPPRCEATSHAVSDVSRSDSAAGIDDRSVKISPDDSMGNAILLDETESDDSDSELSSSESASATDVSPGGECGETINVSVANVIPVLELTRSQPHRNRRLQLFAGNDSLSNNSNITDSFDPGFFSMRRDDRNIELMDNELTNVERQLECSRIDSMVRVNSSNPNEHSPLQTNRQPPTFIDLTNDTFSLDDSSDSSSVGSDLSELTAELSLSRHSSTSPQRNIFSDPLPPIRQAGIIGVSFNRAHRRAEEPNPRLNSDSDSSGGNDLLSDLSALIGPRPNSVARRSFVGDADVNHSDTSVNLSLPRPLPRSPTRSVARTEEEVAEFTMSPAEGASYAQPLSTAADELLAQQLSEEINSAEQQRHNRFMTAMSSHIVRSRMASLAPDEPPAARATDTTLSIPDAPRATAAASTPPSLVDSHAQRIITLVQMGDDLLTNIVRYREMTDNLLDDHVLLTLMLIRRIDMLRFSLVADENDYEALWELSERLGEVRERGLSAADIDKLPCSIYDAQVDTVSECHICLAAYETKEQLRYLDCKHDFHAACIDEWLKRNATCPICRKNFKTS